MRFTDQASSTTTRASKNPLESTFMLADTTDRVEGFFSRPQRIASFEWTPNVGLHQEFNPWTLYFNNDKVRERLSNFSLLRCKMHIRVMVNATKFYYGRLLLSYRPMHLNDTLTTYRPGEQLDHIEATQRPCVIIDPTADEVGEMSLPYMYPKSALLIPAREWERMGLLTLSDLTPLRNANMAVDPITVTVFAWATDVEYSQPTSVVYEPEGGDEYFDGPISKPAHKVARFANHLANVPIIGLYARATEMVASAGAAVARLFGYARPTICESEHLYTPYFGKRLAATNVEDTCDPLSLDVKKEVPIDPRICGMGPEDHMAFVPLAKREVYLTSFNWDASQPSDTFLFNIHASPTQRAYETPTRVHTTPAAWIASLFEYWRGTMSIRFEVVCSSFHRGRLRLVYDPIYQVTDEFNVNYTHIMDLSSETDYTMDIGWAQNVPYLEIDHLNSGNDSFSDSAQFTRRIGNGVLTVYIVNSLTTPSESIDPVTVNVYVSMNDDFEVQGPTGEGLRDLRVEAEEEVIPPPVVPQDPPESVPFTPEVRGPVTFSSIVNSGYSGSILSKPETSITSEVDSMVIGGKYTTQVYHNQHTMRVTRVKPGINVADIVFRTDSTNPPPLQLDGIDYPWTEPSPGEYTVNVSLPINVDSTGVGSVPIICVLDGPLVLESIIMDRTIGSGVVNAGDPSFAILGPGVSLQSDAFGDYYQIPQGSSITWNNPGTILRDTFVEVTVNNGLMTFNGVTKEVRSTNFPIRSFETVESQLIEVGNLSAGTLKLYSMSFDAPLPVPTFDPEGGEEELQEQRIEIVENVAGTAENLPQVSDVFFGELPSSFRQVMKRYTLTETLRSNTLSKTTFTRFANPRTTGRGQVKPADVSIWMWCMSPYLGWKGSTRHKIIADNPDKSVVTISRIAGGIAEPSTFNYPIEDDTNISWDGSTTGCLDHQIAEAVIPWYSNMRFRNCRITQLDDTYQKAPGLAISTANTQSTIATRSRWISSGGEDYSLYFWVSTPIVNVFRDE